MLLVERIFLGKKLDGTRCKFINHIYTLSVVGIGWVIFRCDSLKEALKLLFYMVRWQNHNFYAWYDFFSVRSLVIVLIAVFLVGFIQESVKGKKISHGVYARVAPVAELVWQMILLTICMILLIGGQYNPFIYFKF